MSDFIPEEYVNEDDNLCQKYRSIAVVPSTVSEFDRSFLARPNERREFSTFPLKTPAIEFPSKPMMVGRHSFVMKSPKMSASKMSGPLEEVLNAIISHIGAFLAACDAFHFSFIPGNTQRNKYPMWLGKHIDGSTCCEVEVHIFHGDESDSYILDAVRVKGDAVLFHSFFRTFKSLVLNTHIEPIVVKKFPVLPPRAGKVEDMHTLFKPIFALCRSEDSREARLEGVKLFYKILCRMREANEPGLSEENFRKICIEHVERLMCDECDDVNQHAYFLFGYLSQIECYKSALIKSELLPSILDKVDYVPEPYYDSIHIRRVCASILATLSQYDSEALVKNFRVEVKSWTSRVSKHNLQFDSEVYMWAQTAHSHLSVLV